MYRISSYTRRRARELGVTVRPAANRTKKLDVFARDDPKKKLVSVGAAGYGDYPTFLRTRGRAFATRRRKAYKTRHEKDRHVPGTAGFFADRLLW